MGSLSLKYLALDIDGVLTDGTELIGADGRECKRICFRDLDAVHRAQEMGLAVVFITGESGPLVEIMARRFGVNEMVRNAKDKAAALRDFAAAHQASLAEICYVGDSDREAPALALAGMGMVPADASLSAKRAAHIILKTPGGKGVVAEILNVLGGKSDGNAEIAVPEWKNPSPMAVTQPENPAAEGQKNVPHYLEVTYSPAIKPYTKYPTQLAEQLLKSVYRKSGKLLDVGCGRGDHLRAFSDLGFNVAGVDISSRASELSPGFDVRIANLEKEEMPFAPASFEYVFSKSVIEHLHDPDQILSKCFQVLRPGGIAVMMTPSWRHVYRTYYEDYTHTTPFTANSLREALEINGFAEVQVSYFWQLPFLWRLPWLIPAVQMLAKFPIPYRPVHRAPWPDLWNKTIRFSREVMLLGVGRRPAHGEKSHGNERPN